MFDKVHTGIAGPGIETLRRILLVLTILFVCLSKSLTFHNTVREKLRDNGTQIPGGSDQNTGQMSHGVSWGAVDSEAWP